jgi:tRNA-dihydrouridine synthase 1
MIQDAGAAVLCVHGRTRENKGKECTPADWSLIRKIKQHLSIPVIANGNIAVFEDIQKCLDETGCDAVMSAESLRRNPALFSGRQIPGTQLAREYLALARQYGHAPCCIRAHVMRMTIPLLNKWHDMRDLASRGDKHMTWDEYEAMLAELERRVACDSPPVVTEVKVQKDLDYDPPQLDLFGLES